MEFQEYLLLSRCDRFSLQKELSDWVENANDQMQGEESPPSSAPPRAIRRTGLF